MVLLSFCLVASSCGTTPTDDDDSSVTDDDDSGVEGGSVEGIVSRSADLTGDGLGSLYVTISDGSIKGEPPTIVGEDTLSDQDFSDPESTLEFVVHGIPPRPEPYQVEIFFDEDESGGQGGPSSGDLTISSPVPVTVPTEDSVKINIVLDVVAP